MKKVLSLPILLFMFVSCTKEVAKKKEVAQDGKRPIKFSLADFTQSVGNLRTAGNNQLSSAQTNRDALSQAGISDIYYVVYSSNGTKLNFVHTDTLTQKNGFGTITDSLAPGTYTAVIIASQKPLYVEPILSADNISSHYFGLQLMGMAVIPMGDAFLKKTQFTITQTDTAYNIAVALDRIVGKLEVKLLDALPANDPKGLVYIRVTPLTAFYRLASGLTDTPDPTWQWNGTRTGQTTFSDYLLGSDNEFNVIIGYQDKTTGEMLTKKIEHVKCQANKKTIIQGYLYGTPDGSRGYDIYLNNAWSNDSTVIHL